jgi:capsular exopolysaccharide synthesis family protein
MHKNNQDNMLVPTQGSMPAPPMDYYNLEMEQEIHLQDYWRVIVKRRAWVLGFALGLVVLVTAVCLIMTPIYKSSSLIQIVKDNPGGMMGSSTSPLSSLTGESYDSYFYETQLNILKSRELILRVIKQLNLETYAEFKDLKEKYPEKSPVELDSDMVDLFLDKLNVDPVKSSYLFYVSYKSTDKLMAQKVADTLIEEYIQFNMERRGQSFNTVKRWLEGELQQIANSVDASLKKLYSYGQQTNIYPPDDNSNVIVAKFVELGTLLTKAQAEASAKLAQFKQIQEKGANAPLIVNNPLVVNLRQSLVAQEAKVASMLNIFKDDYPRLQTERGSLKEQQTRLNAEIDRIMTSVKSDYEAAARAEKMLNDAFEGQKKEVATLQNNSIQYKILKRDMDTYDALYQGLLSRMKDASVAATMVSSNLSIIEHGNTPVYPWIPRNLLFIALAAVVGLMGGVGLAFLVEYCDTSIKTSEEMERFCRLPTLGVIPRFAKSVRKGEEEEDGSIGLLTIREPKSMLSEAIRHVRTAMMLSISGGPPEAIIVTSPNPSEGKTTIAINLAVSLAMEGRKVVIVDADMRKPAIHKTFQQLSQPGLSNFITGSTGKEEIIRSTEIDNLFFVPAGAVPPSPVDLLNTAAFKEFLEDLRAQFQHVIIDTPPLLGFADARLLSSMVDGVLIVIKHHSTPRDAARLANQLLRQVNARVIGAILNQVTTHKLGYGGYYYGYLKYYDKYYSKYYGGNDTKSLDG